MAYFNLENLFENIPDSVSIIDRKYRILLINKSFKQWLRTLKISEKVEGKTVFKAFPFLPNKVKLEYDRVFRTGKNVVTEESSGVNGKRVFTETRKIPIIENKKVVQIITIVRDITKRKKAEEELKASNEKYQALFNKSNDAIFMHDLDGNILDANQRAVELFGYSKKEILSMKIKDVHPPEALQKSKWAFAVVSKRGFVNFQVAFMKKGGAVFPGEVSASMFEIGGKQVIQGIVRDVTEKEVARRALHESRKKYRLIFELSPEVVVLIDKEGVIQEINQAVYDYLGYKPREIIGRSLKSLKFVPKHSRLKLMRNFSKRMAGQKPDPYELDFITKKGALRVGRLFANVLKDDQGNIIGEVGIVSDITDLKEAEKRLRNACAIKGYNP